MRKVQVELYRILALQKDQWNCDLYIFQSSWFFLKTSCYSDNIFLKATSVVKSKSSIHQIHYSNQNTAYPMHLCLIHLDTFHWRLGAWIETCSLRRKTQYSLLLRVKQFRHCMLTICILLVIKQTVN